MSSFWLWPPERKCFVSGKPTLPFGACSGPIIALVGVIKISRRKSLVRREFIKKQQAIVMP